MAAELVALDRAYKGEVTETTNATQQGFRNVVLQSYPVGRQGSRARRKVAGSIRKVLYTKDGPLKGSGLVYSRFGRKVGGRFVDYLLPHVEGETIRPRRGRRLYIPLQRGARARRFRQSVELQKNLRFIPLKDGRILIVRQTKSRSTPIALLVKQVRVDPVLNFRRVEQQQADLRPGRLVARLT